MEALNELHGGSDSSQGGSGCHSVDTITYTQLEPSNQQNYAQNPAAFSLPNNHVQVILVRIYIYLINLSLLGFCTKINKK